MSDNPAAPTTEPAVDPVTSLYSTPEPNQPEPTPAPGNEPPAGPQLAPDPGEPVQEPDPDPGGQEPEEEGISTLSELTEYVQGTLAEGETLGENWLEGLKVPVKVNGAETEATVKDLIDGFQMREASEKRLSDAKAKAQQIGEEAAQKAAAVDAQFAVAAKLIEGAETFLNDDVANIDWQKLRSDDPAEYAAKRDDVKARRERVDAMKRDAVESYQSGIAKQREQAAETLKERLPAEHEALVAKLPEWKDAEKRKAGAKQAFEYLLNEGFTEAEAALLDRDHRLLVLAHKAQQHDAAKSRSNVMKKKVATVPKTIKPGAKQKESKKPVKTDAAAILYG